MPGLHMASAPNGRVFRAKSRPEYSLQDKVKFKQGEPNSNNPDFKKPVKIHGHHSDPKFIDGA